MNTLPRHRLGETLRTVNNRGMKHDEKMNRIQGLSEDSALDSLGVIGPLARCLPGCIEERKLQYESRTANGELYDAFELTKEIEQLAIDINLEI